VGSRLKHYEIITLLGAGGMGEVYRARDLTLGREVALKLLRPDVADDPQQLARFEREARLLAALNHPNIATLFEFVNDPGMRFLVLELVPGLTLAERFHAGPIPLLDALATCAQIAEALEAAHDKGIIHRDLKPANVKVTPEGRVKILDFGLGKIAGDDYPSAFADAANWGLERTRIGVVMGTPPYMSPEQTRGEPLDKRTDIWSFGCILYEILAGRRAFAADSISDTLHAIVAREPDWAALPAGVPPRIRTLLERCLAKPLHARLDDIGEARLVLHETARQLARSPASTDTVLLPAPAATVAPPVTLPAPTLPPPVRPAATLPALARSAFRGVLLGLLVIALFLGGAGVLLFTPLGDRLIGRSPPDRPITALAVVPFRVVGESDPELDAFARNLSATVPHLLAGVPRLHVREVPADPAASIAAPRQIGQEFGAHAVLVGEVEKRGGILTIYLDVIDVATNTPRWSRRIERPLQPPGTVPWAEELATLFEDVVQEIGAKLPPWLAAEASRRGSGR
jgi:TolB-like protein